ncbi:hypothetical protein [Nostoc sp. MG11]|uniref:hypothetical protein n=1 Tax=Nostoc sp. MG11 TaxID=2721166 RepID=UPI0029FED378|nr:hypothetical protein [Nostoc sp. MG11]
MENLEPKDTRDLLSSTQSRHLLYDVGRQERSSSSIPNEDANTSKIQLILYLIPVIGFFPSLWTLYRRQGSREQLATSRLSITLASAWLLGYLLLATGAATSDLFTLRLFILNSFLTSGYFLISVWLIIRLLQGRSKRLPGFSNFAERMLGKYLS